MVFGGRWILIIGAPSPRWTRRLARIGLRISNPAIVGSNPTGSAFSPVGRVRIRQASDVLPEQSVVPSRHGGLRPSPFPFLLRAILNSLQPAENPSKGAPSCGFVFNPTKRGQSARGGGTRRLVCCPIMRRLGPSRLPFSFEELLAESRESSGPPRRIRRREASCAARHLILTRLHRACRGVSQRSRQA